MNTWIIKNSVLCIKHGDSYLIPSAMDIFKAVFKSATSVCSIENIGSPALRYPSLSFSSYPLDLKLEIIAKSGSGNHQFFVDIIGRLGKSEYELGEYLKSPDSPDHIVIDNTWYPVAQGAIQEIFSLIEDTDIAGPGRITLRQYLNLIVKHSDSLIIEDNVRETSHVLNTNTDDASEQISSFTGNLYPYQFTGYKWLKMIAEEDAGCILADEMGLGKTIQIIALVANDTSCHHEPSLVVAPATLMENWRREVFKFAPDLKVLIHQGSSRTGFHSTLRQFNLVVTSYETVVRDISMFKMIKWNIVILDEAQAIKNPEAQRTKTVKHLPRRVSVAVTGTPFENHITDLWSLTDFILPGLMGTLKFFKTQYQDDSLSAESIEPVLSPIMLRRRVSDVATDLPERLDIPQALDLDENSALEYEKIRSEVAEKYGKSASLPMLSALRMFCTHPYLIDGVNENPNTRSIKFRRTIEILEEIFQNNEKALIFTSYTKMSDLMVSYISKEVGVFCDFIDGRVNLSQRQVIIDNFTNASGPGVLVLNPRAAGVGLNITAANHVIHYNLEWNPALEDQASARAYRRGQGLPVTVHRLFYANTVEEVINLRIMRKRFLADKAVVGTEGSDDYTDIVEALKLSPIIGGRQND